MTEQVLLPLLLTDSDAFAGTERHMLELALGLKRQGIRGVRVACPKVSPLAERACAAGIGVLPVEKRGLVDRDAVRLLSAELRSGRATIVHAHNGRTALAAAMAVRLAGQGRCVATQHFLEPDHTRRTGAKGALFHAAHRWVDRNTHHHVAVSRAIREAMVARREGGRHVTVIPNGLSQVDPAALRPPHQVRAELGLAPGTPLAVCVARLEPEKDVATLVRAMAEVARARPDAVCVVAGQGAQRQELEREIAVAGLGERIRLIGFRDDALSLMGAADLFALPSLAEPFGLVLLEAMALGRPVVATRAGGPVEIVADGDTGFLVRPGDAAAMAEAMLRLFENPGHARRMGEAGRERFLQLFTADRMAAETLRAYQSLS